MPVKIIDNTIHSVKGILYQYDASQKLQFLMVEEADTGLLGFPGGAQDEEDANNVATLEREVREEIGLTSNAYTIVDPDITYEFVHEDPKSPRYLKNGVLHVYLLAYNTAELLQPSDELSQVMWLSKEEVIDRLGRSYSYWLPVFQKVLEHLNA